MLEASCSRYKTSLASVHRIENGRFLQSGQTVRWSLPLGTQRVMEAMRAGPKSPLCSGKMVALAAGLSVGATVGYLVYRQVKSTSSASMASTEESRMSIPLDVYRNIAKYQASFLDLVIKKSGAHVRVLPAPVFAGEGEQGSQNTVSFLFQGSPQQVLLARCALENLATDCETTSDVMEVPQTAFGRIIGRGGESLKLITRTTGARVICPRERGRGFEMGKVSITGTRREVRQAKELIMEKVFEDEAVKRKITQSSALRQKRRLLEPQIPNPEDLKPLEASHSLPVEGKALENGVQATRNAPALAAEDDVQLAREALEVELEEDDDVGSPDSLLEVSKFEIPSPDLSFQPDEHLEVYVSASENPHHFWIQILGVRSLQLDKLTAEMSRFYSNGTSQEQRVESIVVGDIVAASYRDHGTWNRARVLGVLGSGMVDLYYVDFGDNGELPRDSLRSMRSDFLSLPFQAIECSLAGVKPADEVWSDEALDDFDRLTSVAEWRPLLAKLCSYSHSEISSWPSVQLYDNKDGKTVDLGEELVRLGHAVPSQCNGDGRSEQDNPGLLQRMLDDVTGATSELSLSCVSLSGTGHGNGEWVSELASRSHSFSGSLSRLELQRADVDDSPTTGFGYRLAHSTPAQRTLVDLVSHILASPCPTHQPLSPDHQVPSQCCDTFNCTSNLYSISVPQLQLTRTLPVSLCTSSSSTSASSLGLVTSALDSISLSDNVFLEGSSYDGDEECDGTTSSGEVEANGKNSTWSLCSSDRGNSLEEEEDNYEEEEDVETCSERASSISSSAEGPSVILISGSSDCRSSTCSSIGSDVIYIGSVEPGWEKSPTLSCHKDDVGNSQSQPFHLCVETDMANTPGSQTEVDEKTAEQKNQLGEPKMKSRLVKGALYEPRTEHFVGFHSPEKLGTESESAVTGLPQSQRNVCVVTAPTSLKPFTLRRVTNDNLKESVCREVASISGSVDDVLEDEFI
ncbi:hypothetical protein DPEC_G00330510 [Dallia pectoralis]|uniref:Uncharacterized protein n=1 Tax=Dallia pectoralis TaxID=75939 RepID=A0ACC2F8X7_DALPE|nr:hypothetical protein DPEC_G00330510 [Dallia pectoralis]